MSGLDAPMQGDGCRAEPMTEAHRQPLKAAAARLSNFRATTAPGSCPKPGD